MMVEVNQWQGMQVMRNTAFREVHKNAWLKMVLVENKVMTDLKMFERFPRF